ncbi:hypothetical protein N9009_00500 [bacterium]|nr:hypothetical protein [bacterium]
MSNGNTNGRVNVQEIKQVAKGRWAEVITTITGIPSELLDGKGHPCPRCNGSDRFSAFPDFNETGSLLCRHCHNGDTSPKSGDGISAIQWLMGVTFPNALALIAEHLGIAGKKPKNDHRDILSDLCKQKRMPLDSAKAYGAKTAIRGRNQVVRFPVYDDKGNPTCYSDVSPYATGKLNKGMLPKGGKAGFHFPGRLPNAGETWLIVEGVKDAAVLHGLGYSAAGVTGCNLPNSKRAAFAKLFTGCKVVLVPDLDRASHRGFANIGTAFKEIAETILLARLPGEIKPTKGLDVRDTINAGGPESIHRIIEQATEFDAEELLGGRGAVYLNIDEFTEMEVADKVIRILAAYSIDSNEIEKQIFQRAGKLVAIVEPDTDPRIVSIDEISIRERITAAMDLIETNKSRTEETETVKRPPGWLCKAIHARPTYEHVRRLDDIVTAPTMRADGSILQTTGYDPHSRLVYLPDCDYKTIPANPNLDDARNAVGELLDIVHDFPFANDAAKSVWISLVLSLIGRPAIVGNIPLFGFTANIRGSGKSKLCDLAGLIAYGRPMARKTLPGDDDETRKVITAIAIESKSAVLFDNAAGLIGNASLDAVLTADTWNDRILGKSETTGNLPWRTVLVTTGNNLTFKADTARRVTLCQLDCRHETPEDRNDFKHANVEAHTLKHRPLLVVAALTVLRAFVVAERPYSGNRLGSFESWSETICGAIVFSGMPNPLETVSIVRDQDNTGAIVRMLLDGLDAVAGVDGLTSREILDGIKTDHISKADDIQLGWESLQSAFAELTDKPSSQRIGGALKRFHGRVCDNRRIVNRPGRSNVKRWTVEVLSDGNDVPDAPTGLQLNTLNDIDIGNCDQCGKSLIATPTSDGYLNRHCDQCEKPFKCVPIPVDAIDNLTV